MLFWVDFWFHPLQPRVMGDDVVVSGDANNMFQKVRSLSHNSVLIFGEPDSNEVEVRWRTNDGVKSVRGVSLVDALSLALEELS